MKKILDKNIEIAKNIITATAEEAGYKVVSIILFGSRAKGNYREDSDYDFFVVIDKEISSWDEALVTAKMRRQLNKLGIYCDILISFTGQLKENYNVGDITYYALKYGVRV